MLQRVAPIAIAAAVAGCAGMNMVSSDVSSFGEWPAGRAPGSYVFERLPSQQARAEQQAALELAARGALEKAGFTAVADAAAADVTVQLTAQVQRVDRSTPFADPFYWGFAGWGGRPYWRSPFWYGGGYGGWGAYENPYYERNVAVLIRDRASGKALYESRANSDGVSVGGTPMLAAMFDAALKDFPRPALSPRQVTTPLPEAEAGK
jgi:Domain of unknown function (DUF4136)